MYLDVTCGLCSSDFQVLDIAFDSDYTCPKCISEILDSIKNSNDNECNLLILPF